MLLLLLTLHVIPGGEKMKEKKNLSDSMHCHVQSVLAMDINHTLDNQIPFLPCTRSSGLHPDV